MSDVVEREGDGGGVGPSDEVTDPQALRALGFVQMLIEKMDMDAEVTLAPDDGEGSADEIRLEIEGPDAAHHRQRGRPRGDPVLDRASPTSRASAQAHRGRREGYRARHEDQLAEMAKKLARRVAKEGKVITFDPMTARDRVVHMALKDITDVRTESHGEGPDRRVQIIP